MPARLNRPVLRLPAGNARNSAQLHTVPARLDRAAMRVPARNAGNRAELLPAAGRLRNNRNLPACLRDAAVPERTL